MESEKAIDALNSLITINNDRIEGYQKAAEVSEEQDLNTLFAQFISTSQKCKQELVTEVSKMGGKVAEGTKTTGKFFRAWMDVKAALTGKDRKAIIESCEYGEDQARETYVDVLENELSHLSTEQKTLIIAQKALLKVDHDQVKTLRDSLVNT